MKVFLAVAALAGLVTAQSRLEFSKYHLSQCTEGYIAHAAREMTGTEAIEEGKYGYCLVYTQDDIFFDWKCLCRAGDGEGSAIIDTARQAGLVGLDCGWDYTFGTSPCLRCNRASHDILHTRQLNRNMPKSSKLM